MLKGARGSQRNSVRRRAPGRRQESLSSAQTETCVSFSSVCAHLFLLEMRTGQANGSSGCQWRAHVGGSTGSGRDGVDKGSALGAISLPGLVISPCIDTDVQQRNDHGGLGEPRRRNVRINDLVEVMQ